MVVSLPSLTTNIHETSLLLSNLLSRTNNSRATSRLLMFSVTNLLFPLVGTTTAFLVLGSVHANKRVDISFSRRMALDVFFGALATVRIGWDLGFAIVTQG